MNPLAKYLLPALALAASPALADEATVAYEVADMKGKLLLELDESKEPLATGAQLHGGQRLRTGWMSWSDLSAPDYGSRFHLGSRTRVRLASDTPGVLLVLERGRLRALFDKVLGEAPPDRRIRTPSAVLAVRGTEYGVAVSGAGHTTLVVFEGAVEVVDREGMGPPVVVEPGFALEVRRGRAAGNAYRHGLTSSHWDRGAMPGAGGYSGMSPGGTARHGHGGSSMGSGGTRRGGGGSRGHGGGQ